MSSISVSFVCPGWFRLLKLSLVKEPPAAQSGLVTFVEQKRGIRDKYLDLPRVDGSHSVRGQVGDSAYPCTSGLTSATANNDQRYKRTFRLLMWHAPLCFEIFGVAARRRPHPNQLCEMRTP